MTVSSTSRLAGPFTGTGVSYIELPFDWKVFIPADLLVARDNDPLVIDADYVVSLNEDQDSAPGGLVRIVEAANIAAAEYFLTSVVPATQLSDLPSQSAWRPKVVENALDKLTILIQQLTERIGRALIFPPGTSIDIDPDPDSVLGFDADGDLVTIPVDEFQGATGSPGGNVMAIGLFTGAAALTIPVGTDIVQTSGYNVAGKGHALYVADTAVDAAYVAANPRGAFITANGRGFRLSREQQINVLMFGAAADNVTDDLPAFQAALTMVKTLGAIQSANYRRTPVLHVPLAPVSYYLSDTLELLDATYHLIGEGGGGSQNGSYPVVLRFAPGKPGIIVHFIDTIGETTRPEGIGAQGSLIENLMIYTDGAGGSTTADGIRLRAFTKLINCNVYNFPRHGLSINASAGSGGATEGNANLFQVRGGNYWRNGQCGIYMKGADTNAGIVDGCNVSYNGTWGIWDDSFLGNLISGCHADENGVKSAGPIYAPNTRTCQCTHGGQRYGVILGQEVGASANAPSGAISDNTWWRWLATGGVHTIYPAWFAGIPTQVAGPYRATEPNSRSLFLGCYSEQSQSPSLIGPTSMGIGGLQGAGVIGPFLTAGTSTMICTAAIGSQSRQAGGDVCNTVLGGAPVGATMILSQFGRSPTGAAEWRCKINAAQDWYYDYAHLGTSTPFQITGPGTTFMGGRSVPQPYAFNVVRLFLGPAANAREITYAAAAPAADEHAQGEIVFNNAPVAGGKVGWVCTVAGTPGTWKAFGPIDP